MSVGLVLQILAAALLIAVGVIFAGVGAIEEAVVTIALGGWWTIRCCRRL